MKRRFVTNVFYAVCLAFALLLGVMLAARSTRAANLDVCSTCAYTTIQAAIDDAMPGDVIRVGEGTYNEQLVITKSVTLMGGYTDFSTGARTPRASTISGITLQGGIAAEPRTMVRIYHRVGVVPVANGGGAAPQGVIPDGIDVVIDGFEITGGSASDGGGIAIDIESGSSVVINDNYVHNNSAGDDGGGLYIVADDRSDVAITNNDVMTNSAGGEGGGLYVNVYTSGTLTLTGNEVSFNETLSTTNTTSGAGLYIDVENFVPFRIEDNTVMSNTTAMDGNFNPPYRYYGGMYFSADNHCHGTFDRNQFIGNYADNSHGGARVNIRYNSSTTFYDNVFERNRTMYWDEGGLYLQAYANSHVTGDNLVLRDNVAGRDYGGSYVEAEYASSIRLPNTQVTGNEAGDDYGGARFEAYDNSLVDVPNLYVYDNHAFDGDVGGVYLYVADGNDTILAPDTVVVENSALDSSTAYGGGLYVYVSDGSRLDLRNLQVLSNTVESTGSTAYGGGLYGSTFEYGSRITMTNALFRGNVAHSSGGTSNAYGGGAYFSNGPTYNSWLDISDSEFISNTAHSDSYYAYGGGLYLSDQYYNQPYTLSITSTLANRLVFRENVALGGRSAYGGGAYISEVYEGASLELNDSLFASNVASTTNSATYSGRGGGLYFEDCYEGCYVSFSGNTFEYNHALGNASSYGGGMHYDEAYEGVEVHLDDNTFRYNSASGDGGGLYVDYLVYEGGMATLRNSSFISNTAGDDGGGLYIDEYAAEYGAQAFIDDNVFRDNVAGEDGGGAYIYYLAYGGAAATFRRNEVVNNHAGSYGGGAYIYYGAEYGSEAILDDNVFEDNVAGSYGGGVYMDYLSYDGSLGSFQRNRLVNNQSGSDGGGIYMSGALVYDGGTAYFNDNWIEGNVADDDCGGACLHDVYGGAVAEINRNTVISNTASGDGAGIYLDDIEYGAQLQFNDNVVNGNVISSTGGYSGGGLYIYTIDEGSTVWMRNNQFNDNVATGYGGGIYIDDYVDYGSIWYFEDNEIQRNWAGDDGGGCFFDDYWYDGSAVYFNRNRINDNVALGEAGGCYFYDIEYAIVDFIGNEVNRNTAGEDYGGLYFESVYDGAVMRFWDTEIIGNRAGIVETAFSEGQIVPTPTHMLGGSYGGIYLEDLDSGGEVDFRRNEVLSNTAYLAGSGTGEVGGMYADLDEGGLLTMVDSTIAGNTAQADFGGLFVELDDGARLDMEHNVIRANTAVTMGGGLAIAGGDYAQYWLRRNQIVGNSAPVGAGLGIRNGTPNSPMWGYSENNLIADNTGAGVFLLDARFFSTNDTIADNTHAGVAMTGTITATAYLSNTILWGNGMPFNRTDVVTYTDRYTMMAEYSDIEGGWPGVQNLDVDPLFVGGGDYHLQETSPVVDQANTSTAPATDLDGVPRPVPLGGDADIGAYEWFRSGVLLASNQAKSGAPGTVVTYTLTISNTGNAATPYLMSVASNPLGWSVSFSESPVLVPAGESRTVVVMVTVPSDGIAGTVDSIIVQATSSGDPTVLDVVTLDTTVSLVPALTFEPDDTAIGLPDNTVVYVHTLTNLGNGTDTFMFGAVSEHGWTVAVVPSSVSVNGGAARDINVFVTVPANALPGTTDVVTVTATSQTDAMVTGMVYDTTTVYEMPGLNFELYLPLAVRQD